jgi:hypothetical protein
LAALRSRPVLAAPHTLVETRERDMVGIRDRARRALDSVLQEASGQVTGLAAAVRALSPAATLDRGYAVVQGPTGIVRMADDVAAGDEIRVRVAVGTFGARVTEAASTTPADRKQAGGARATESVPGKKPTSAAKTTSRRTTRKPTADAAAAVPQP